MNKNKALKKTLHDVVLHAVNRMEYMTDDKNRRCIFHEYKEWLGSSIDDWVLSLPNNWNRSDSNFY